jgi:hypothetical protein
VAGTGARALDVPGRATKGWRILLYGTLGTNPDTAAAEADAGVRMAMLEVYWDRFEPRQNVVNQAYATDVKTAQRAYQEAGLSVTLGLDMASPPSWVFGLADSYYINKDGQQAAEPAFVFSNPVRKAAAYFMARVADAVPFSNFVAARITSCGNGEMLYPDNGPWAFSSPALTGRNLPAGMTANPFPRWKPGHAGITEAQVDQWVNWYVGGLVNVTQWAMNTCDGLGFRGYFMPVTPGSGTRPSDLAASAANYLAGDDTTAVGAVWHRYYAGLPNKSRVIAYVSSVADGSGNDDCTLTTDVSVPLSSPDMDGWSAARWITRIAHEYRLAGIAGENPGYGASPELDERYVDTSADGMMATALRQAKASGFTAFYWAHDARLWDGTVPFGAYATMINS